MATKILRTLEGRERIVPLDAERPPRRYRKRRASFGSAEEQLSPNAERFETVRTTDFELTEHADNGQQDYPLSTEHDVATEPQQTIPEGPPSPEVAINMPENKSSSVAGWRQSDDPLPGDKSSSTLGWRHPDELLHTSNVEQRHVPVPAHIVRPMRTVEQTPASAYLTGLTEVDNSGTESVNAQETGIEDSVSKNKGISKGTTLSLQQETFQKARKTFRNVPRPETPKAMSRLASPFNQGIDIEELNKRTHKYDGMHQEHEGNIDLDTIDPSKLTGDELAKWMYQKVRRRHPEATKGMPKRLEDAPPFESTRPWKKDPGKPVPSNKKSARANKGKAPDIRNYGQVELDSSSEADSDVQRMYFQEIEHRRNAESGQWNFRNEGYSKAPRTPQELPVRFKQETYRPKIENEGKDTYYGYDTLAGQGDALQNKIPAYMHHHTDVQGSTHTPSAKHDIKMNRPNPDVIRTVPDASDDSEDESETAKGKESEEKNFHRSSVPPIKRSADRNSKGHRKRTTRDTAEPQSSNTPQTNRFASVRPSDNLARKSYVNRAIQRAEIVKRQDPDPDPGDSSSDSSDSSGYSSSDDGNDSDALFEPTDIDSSDSEGTKKRKKLAKRKWNKELLKLKIQMQSAKPIVPTVYSGEPNLQRYTKTSGSTT
ncbi:uncharacterized protein FOMMEDRAFT_163101 [Fomitiporia mediterranea MF3/22]|uniref:Uncharacterized protein n=1 Tax=Fomitiporia mediterranea (strain MF3/22) TaxID=694068 RepID=R7SFK9_FOMME|nr:uncharacterized protein FOMMEDRAFT_163101 [Fomitiporia mediterranea MF3/22]EJC97493.1 hypothetical protein FOMMEDRAFT_163101 [Fomitiporia mediterranea MF3/22]